MLDTGATINCIRNTLVQKLGMSDRVYRGRNRKVLDSQGKNMKVHDDLGVPVGTGNTSLCVKCVVVDFTLTSNSGGTILGTNKGKGRL